MLLLFINIPYYCTSTICPSLGANPAVIAAAKEKLLKAEKQLKVLDVKDAADKALALEAVAKLVKKMKKGGKKPKK